MELRIKNPKNGEWLDFDMDDNLQMSKKSKSKLIIVATILLLIGFLGCSTNYDRDETIEIINNSLYTKYIYENQMNKYYIESYEIVKINIENDTCYIWKGQNGGSGGLSCK